MNASARTGRRRPVSIQWNCAAPIGPGRWTWRLGAALAVALPGFAVAADSLEQLGARVSGGKPNVELRVRSETVEQDNFDDDGRALTARARVGYTTAAWNALDAQLEYEGARSLGSDEHYNSSENGHTDRPMVADPDFDELNQAWIRWSGLPKTAIKYGRQRIVFDNARFVGNAGWRQNEATFDAALLSTQIIPRTTLSYARVTNVDSFRYFDFDPGAGVDLDNDLDVAAHLVNAAVSVIDQKLKVVAYGYRADFRRVPAGPVARLFADTQTFGLRATGAVPLHRLVLSYAAEFARQDDYADAASMKALDYSLLELGVAHGAWKLSAGRERLGSNGQVSVQTPLATAHAHQGWADQFLVTPVEGLERRYAGLGATVRKLTMALTYHQFDAARGGADYGDEVDLLASYALIENLSLSAKLARYHADQYPVAGTPPSSFDTTKSWVYAEYKF